jgi:hypothetical protein
VRCIGISAWYTAIKVGMKPDILKFAVYKIYIYEEYNSSGVAFQEYWSSEASSAGGITSEG